MKLSFDNSVQTMVGCNNNVTKGSPFLHCPLHFIPSSNTTLLSHGGTVFHPLIVPSKRRRLTLRSFSVPPAPRLVCVETNPGPNPRRKNRGKSKGKSVIALSIEQGATSASGNASSQMALVRSKYGKRKNKAVENLKHHPVLRKHHTSLIGNMTKRYLSTLADPFSYGGLKLGFNTFAPTNQATLYSRFSITTSLDGAFQLFLMPANGIGSANARGGIYYSTSAAPAAPVFAQNPWQNQLVVSNQGSEARVVSGGVRVLPLVAGTAVPGVIYNSQIPTDSFLSLTSSTANAAASYPFTQWGDGRKGATGLVRPSDIDAMNFQVQTALGYGDNAATFYTVPRIVGLGFPASTSIFVEAVLHIECLPSIQTSVANYINGGNDDESKEGTLVEENFSLDNLWSKMRQYLPSAEQMTVATDLLDMWQNGRAFRPIQTEDWVTNFEHL